MYGARLPFCVTLNDKGWGRSIFGNHFSKQDKNTRRQNKTKKPKLNKTNIIMTKQKENKNNSTNEALLTFVYTPAPCSLLSEE